MARTVVTLETERTKLVESLMYMMMMMMMMIFKKEGGGTWNELIWLRIGTGGWLL